MTVPAHTTPPGKPGPMHVWVDFTGAFREVHCYPGILLERRQELRGAVMVWFGLVAFAQADAHGWSMTTKWVPFDHLRPVEREAGGKGAAPGAEV